MLGSAGAVGIGLVVFFLLRMFIPPFYFEGVPALTLLIFFAVSFVSAAIGLRLGRACNSKFGGELSRRKLVLFLGGLMVVVALFTVPGRDRATDISIFVQILGALGPLLATPLIWLQSAAPIAR